MKTLLVTGQDLSIIVKHVGMDELMDRTILNLTKALAEVSEERTELHPRAGFRYEWPHPGVLEWMPHMQIGQNATIKIVAYNPTNPGQTGLPTIVSTIGVFDLANGHLAALIDGAFPTALRTGAASAIASRILAYPDSDTVGLVGCGAQAVAQLHALSRIFPLREAVVYDIDPERAKSYSSRAAFIGLPIRMASLQEVEESADILCTATSVAVGEGPVIRGHLLRDHIHINAIGSDLPGKTELPLSLLKTCLLCPDHQAQAMVEGECQQVLPEEIGPDLVELVRHPAQYAAWHKRKTIFDSTGFGLEDNVIAELVLALAHEYQLGTWVNLEHCPADPYNPYDFSQAFSQSSI